VCDLADEHENARADDRPYAQRRERHRPQHAAQAVFARHFVHENF
jgi:hypothetical protein